MLIVTRSQKTPRSWLIVMGTLTFGLVTGFSLTALPFLLDKIVQNAPDVRDIWN